MLKRLCKRNILDAGVDIVITYFHFNSDRDFKTF